VRSGTAAARDFRSHATDAKRKLWSRLRDRRLGGLKFRRQFAMGPFFLDFYCVEQKLAVELDGGGRAEDIRQVEHDLLRTRLLEDDGIRVLRFWNDQVLKHPDDVAEQILNAVVPLSHEVGEG
jgi:very-short-patch-repair endonuclease